MKQTMLKKKGLMKKVNTIYTFLYKTIFLKYRTRQIKATETNK